MANQKQKRTQLPWKLIVVLGAVALLRPVIKIFGEVFGYSLSMPAIIIVSALIALVWIGAIVKLRVRRPVAVLAASGVAYAIMSIFMAVAIQAFIPGLSDEEAKIPVLLTGGLLGSSAFNFVYGAFLGLIAKFVQSRVR